MQLFALNEENGLVQAGEASKQQDYYCLECGGMLRLRSGQIRQEHFYHARPNLLCSQHQKSLKHLQVQWHLYRLFGKEDCRLECHFPTIKRIADCVWLSEKIIFEVQCSSITSEEVLRRNADYGSLGYQVVWLFHDSLYNQWRLTAAEHALTGSPHYFTNIDRNGKGVIYDQYAYVHKGKRHEFGSVLPVNVKERHPFVTVKPILKAAKQRVLSWPLFFGGDLVVRGESKKDLQIEKKWEGLLHKKGKPLNVWNRFVVKPYLSLFRYFLDSVCD